MNPRFSLTLLTLCIAACDGDSSDLKVGDAPDIDIGEDGGAGEDGGGEGSGDEGSGSGDEGSGSGDEGSGSGDEGSGSGDEGSGSGDEGSGSGSGEDGGTDDGGSTGTSVDADGDGFDTSEDCDDSDPAVYPGAPETCNDIDDDCNGLVDDGALLTYFADTDSDGYGDASNSTEACAAPSGFVEDDTDCDDGDAAVNPGEAEVCNGTDDNCEGTVDEGVTTTFYADADADGYGDALTSTDDCAAPSGFVADNTDCDDTDGAISPVATETCNGTDDNCDGTIDEGVTTTFYADTDLDGYGDATTTTEDCSAPSGYVADATDCDDDDTLVNPGATELCDGIDNDCDATTTESGTVSFTNSAGTVTDVTSTFTGDLTLSSDGRYAICDGTYSVNLNIEANVELSGPDGAASTVLDGGSAGTVVELDDGYDLLIDGLTLSGGDADAGVFLVGMGGGLYVGSGATASVTNSVISSNTGYAGGGIAVEGGALTVSETDLDSNDGDYGADIIVWGGSASFDGLTATGGSSNASGSFAYIGGYDSAGSLEVEDSAISGGSSAYGAVYIDGSQGFAASFECESSSLTSNTVSTTDIGAVFLGETESEAVAIDCDFGTSAGSDDNSPTDVYTETSDETYAYDDGVFFTCTDEGCEDVVEFDGLTGTIEYTGADWTTSVSTYDCDLEWAVSGTPLTDVCDDCVFGFDTTWTLDTTTAISTNCSSLAVDITYGMAFAADPYDYAAPVLYLEYYGYWYPFSYATFEDNQIVGTNGVLDYAYVYGTTTYYYSDYWEVALEVY